ncbi:MAG: hypothetical protein KGH61_05070 [Candidatus Micrarchaeota archaeon]|nr:hypothetical protein [Candidatus Micrarchaeota archaeon]MDE1848286.1 hypothetical protein [Candidatus Micrarchaeota archaeon]MDE1864311.1 hypothetical protein [Candidatus Micrarchaeota archaeon]
MVLPIQINEEFNRLKKEFPFAIAVQSKGPHYYVYKQTSRWDKENKRVRSVREYLGKITEQGRFIRKAMRDIAIEEFPSPQTSTIKLDENDKKLLTILSMNARADLALYGRQMGLKPNEVYRRVGSLESQLGITYVTEIDVEKLGYLRYFIMVKFLDKKPTTDEIISAVQKVHAVQMALLVKGDYDLVFYTLIKNIESDKIVETIIDLRVGLLEKYESKWYTTPFYEHYGFVPIRDDFIEDMKHELKKREYAVLREINKNSILAFADIDRFYKLDHIHSDYVYSNLKSRGIIKRATISMNKLPIKYVGIIQEEIVNEKKFRAKRVSQLQHIIEDVSNLTNRYILGGNIENPHGTILFTPCFRDGELDSLIQKIMKLKNGLVLHTMIVTSVLFGTLCYRKFDVLHSRQNSILVDEYKINKGTISNYELSGKLRKTRLYGSKLN